MGFKTQCDSCGAVVLGITAGLKRINGQYLCPTCAKVATGQLRTPVNLKCPYCQSDAVVHAGRKFTVAGIIVLLAGLLLAPILVGLILVFAAFKMREVTYRCSNCRKTF